MLCRLWERYMPLTLTLEMLSVGGGHVSPSGGWGSAHAPHGGSCRASHCSQAHAALRGCPGLLQSPVAPTQTVPAVPWPQILCGCFTAPGQASPTHPAWNAPPTSPVLLDSCLSLKHQLQGLVWHLLLVFQSWESPIFAYPRVRLTWGTH
jgi:hypothetical protein